MIQVFFFNSKKYKKHQPEKIRTDFREPKIMFFGFSKFIFKNSFENKKIILKNMNHKLDKLFGSYFKKLWRTYLFQVFFLILKNVKNTKLKK